MSISKEHRDELVNYWLEKAEESIQSASSEIGNDRLSFAINRLYYALFYSMSAILTAKGDSYSKHSGVRSALHRDFIKTGKIDKQVGRLYDELFNARHQADYTPLVEFDKEIVKEQYSDVKEAYKTMKVVAREILA